MPPRPDILGLEWSEEAEAHVEEHIDAWAVDDLIEHGDFFAFPNTAGHPPKRHRIIGRTEAGLFVTVILAEPRDGDPRNWRPVTARQSEPFEREMYHVQSRLRTKK